MSKRVVEVKFKEQTDPDKVYAYLLEDGVDVAPDDNVYVTSQRPRPHTESVKIESVYDSFADYVDVLQEDAIPFDKMKTATLLP